MPTLWPAGPWRFEAAVTITGCNKQSVTNWLQIAQIAASARLRASPTWMKTAHRSTCSGSALDAAVGSARPGFAHIELTRAGACVGQMSPGRVALKTLIGNRLEPSSASSVMIRPSSAANLPACPAPAQRSTRCDPGT